MGQLRTLEHSSGAARGGYGFNPYQGCHAVHPTNGEKCICSGAHVQHWAIYPGGNERTIFSSWVGGAPSSVPPVMTSGRVYPVWQKQLMKLAAIAAAGLVIWLAFRLLSELGG